MNGEKRFGAFEREMLDNYDCPLASVRTFNVIFVCFVLYFDSSLSVFFSSDPTLSYSFSVFLLCLLQSDSFLSGSLHLLFRDDRDKCSLFAAYGIE